MKIERVCRLAEVLPVVAQLHRHTFKSGWSSIRYEIDVHLAQ